MITKTSIAPPLMTFASGGGRTFSLGEGEREERYEGDPLWIELFPIFLDGIPAGRLFRRLAYGTPRYYATTNELRWAKGQHAPTKIGFDVGGFDTPEEAVVAWSESADEILDWSEGKKIRSIYSKSGYFQKTRSES